MSGRLVLVRHGQSHSNVARRLDTRPPGAALTDLGHEQARRFAADLPAAVAAVVHSSALRAEQTAAEIGAAVGIAVQQLDGLHEVQVGELEMRNDDDAFAAFDAVYHQWLRGDLSVSMPGGETGAAVLDRYLPVLTALRARHLDGGASAGDVVVIAHGAAIRLVGSVLGGVDGGFAGERHLANTEAVVLAPVPEGRWSCLRWGAALPPYLPDQRAEPTPHLIAVDDPMG